MEAGLILLLSEILKIITQLAYEKGTVESVWQHCQTLTSQLALWAEDRTTKGILAAIGLGRQSPLSVGVRLVCRTLGTYLNLQMPTEGVFRLHPSQTHRYVSYPVTLKFARAVCIKLLCLWPNHLQLKRLEEKGVCK